MEYDVKYKIASQLISDGYLLHCTDAIFDSFDEKFIKGGMRAKEGYGFYFTDMPYKAIDYGTNFKLIKKENFIWLNSSEQIDTKMFYNEDIEIKIASLEAQLDNVRNNKEWDYINSEIDKYKNKLNSYDEELYFYIKQALKEGAKTYGNLEYLIRNPHLNIPKLIKCYINNGFDGYYTDGIYTVFNTNKLNQLMIKNPEEIIQNYLNNENKIICTNNIMKNKQVIRLTESDLHKIIEESFNNILGNKRPINEDIDNSQHLVSSLLKIYWRLNNCYGRWAFAQDKSQGADNMVETMGSAIKWLAKVIEKIDPAALPM